MCFLSERGSAGECIVTCVCCEMWWKTSSIPGNVVVLMGVQLRVLRVAAMSLIHFMMYVIPVVYMSLVLDVNVRKDRIYMQEFTAREYTVKKNNINTIS